MHGENTVSTIVEGPPSKDTGTAQVLFGGTTRGPGVRGTTGVPNPQTVAGSPGSVQVAGVQPSR